MHGDGILMNFGWISMHFGGILMHVDGILMLFGWIVMQFDEW